MAIFKVLSKKESRLKLLVDLLARDLRGSRGKGKEEDFKGIVSRGMAAISGARY